MENIYLSFGNLEGSAQTQAQGCVAQEPG